MPIYDQTITKAYENDPRTKLANLLVQNGGNTAPVAGGKWAWADGIARALSGLAGGYVQHKQEQKYEKQDQAIADALAGAAPQGIGGAAAPQGGGVAVPPQGGVQEAGGVPPVQTQQPAPAMVPPPPQNNSPDPLAPLPEAPQTAPQGLPPSMIAQGAPAAPQAAPSAPQGPSPASPAVPQIAAALAAGGAANPAAPFGQPKPRIQGASLVQAMLPITAATESNNKNYGANGRPVTSNKGAKYAMQVMPATARKPGFGIRPAQNDSPEEYNRVGTELLGKLTEKYGGDPAKAWAAYNAGSGRVDHALRKHGDNWLAHMPAETRNYVAKNTAALGDTGGSPDMSKPYYADATGDETAPTGPVQYSTPEPEVAALPDRPADRGSSQSYKMAMAQRLMASRNPALMERAMKMLDDGMGEQFLSDRDALAENNRRDDTLYEAGINDHYLSASQRRNAAYETRGREQTEHYAFGREQRGYAHENANREDNQQFTHDERLGSQDYDAGQNDKNRKLQWDIANLNADTKTDIAAKRFQNFLSTPAGSKMYNDTANQIAQNNALSDSVDQFLALNAKNDTGGMIMGTTLGSWADRKLNKDLENMDSLVRDMAPKLRQAGSGSMSDRDLQMFERAIPNIGATRAGNAQRGAQFKAYISRINDFQMHKLEAASSGKQVEFLKEWNTYKSSVPVLGNKGEPGMSFEDWKASIPQYDAQGNRK